MEEMGKEEEIQLWHSFMDALPEQSYLKPLLTGLSHYIAGEIRNDTAIPIMGLLTAETMEKNDLIRDVGRLEARIEGMVKDGISLQAEIITLREQRDNLKNAYTDREDELGQEQDAHLRTRNLLAMANREIERLKAKRFDELLDEFAAIKARERKEEKGEGQ